MPGQSDIHEDTAEGASAFSTGGRESRPRMGRVLRVLGSIHRDGVAFVEGCDVPAWRLEMSRRAGSAPAALIKVFPALTPEGLELAFAYARQHREEIDAFIEELGPGDVPSEEEEDDEAEFQADLDELFERDAEVFRRLAQ